MAYVPADTSSANYLTVPVVDTGTTWQLSIYILNTALTHYIAYITASPSISVIISSGKIQVGAAAAYAEATLAGASGWTHLLITNTAGTVTISQDGTALSVSGTIDASSIWTGNVIMMRGGARIFAPRIINSTLSAATWTYYRAAIVAGKGKVE